MDVFVEAQRYESPEINIDYFNNQCNVLVSGQDNDNSDPFDDDPF